MRNVLFFFLLIGTVRLASAQTQDSYSYQSEFTWGVNKNSSSGIIGGLVLKKARKVAEKQFETYSLEIINIKHPQEQRKNATTGNSFLYGKSNYLVAFRPQYGRDLVIFKKAPQNGVEIKAVAAAGLSFGLVIPYYIEIARGNFTGELDREQYNPKNPEHSFGRISGPVGPFYGLGESSLVMGGNAKIGLNFETGVLKSQVTGYEVGLLLDAYTKAVEIVPTAKNRAIYPTLYLTIFYGTRR